jgi:hypothetical protein
VINDNDHIDCPKWSLFESVQTTVFTVTMMYMIRMNHGHKGGFTQIRKDLQI